MVPLPIIALLLISGKTLLWGMDAYYQQYTSFGYVTNRWCYGYALAVCLTGAWALS